jgi:hypothetical protein
MPPVLIARRYRDRLSLTGEHHGRALAITITPRADGYAWAWTTPGDARTGLAGSEQAAIGAALASFRAAIE